MKNHRNNIGSGVLLVSLMVIPNTIQAQDSIWDKDKWEVSVGAGAFYSPKYEGSDEMEISALPYLDIEWDDRVFLSPHQGLGVHVFRGEALTVSTSIGYAQGRSESDDDKNLRGLGDVDGAPTANFHAEYEVGMITPYLGVSQHLGGTDGLQVEVGVESMIPLTSLVGDRKQNHNHNNGDGRRGLALTLGVSTEWVDDNYAEGFFGVDAAQSAGSGLQQYSAKGGFKSVDAEVGLLYPINDRWALRTAIEYSQLLGDIADSPIVKDSGQLSGGMFLKYTF